MKSSTNLPVRILIGTGVMALLSVAFIAGLAALILKGILPVGRLSVISYILHFAVMYLGTLICCISAKEKKGVCAGLSTAAWYLILLFVAIVLMDCDGSNLITCIGVGACGYGAALLTCMVPKRNKSRKVKFPSR